ncbi:MAG TPA: MarR family transcriptional regulator [Candidatus Nanoarchaeia archaeon]|nr:MarR family transcriptional regulator [Candidatus Nanoarchaeia archaeon]
MEQSKLLKNLGFALVFFSVLLIILLSVVKSHEDKIGLYLCEITHSNPDLDVQQCPAHNSNVSWIILIAMGLGFIILTSGIFLIFLPHQQTTKKASISKLDEDEKKILELLQQNNGSQYQSDLVKETGFSKVKMTRILDKFESKGFIERKRRGMTNVVFLK